MKVHGLDYLDNQKSALRFVFSLGLTIVAVVLVCTLIWIFTDGQDYDVLGFYIIISAIIFILFGIGILVGRRQAVHRKALPTKLDSNRRRDKNRTRPTRPTGDTRLVMFLSGVGLLCLFIGNLIMLGL